MGRRDDEKVQEPLPEAVDEVLDDLHEAFAEVRFPNLAMQVLAELALVEYGLASRAMDRKGWHQQLLQVARACAEMDNRGTGQDRSSRDEVGVAVHDEGEYERQPGPATGDTAAAREDASMEEAAP